MQTKLAIWNETSPLLYPTQTSCAKRKHLDTGQKTMHTKAFLGVLNTMPPRVLYLLLRHINQCFIPWIISIIRKKLDHLAERCSKTEREREQEERSRGNKCPTFPGNRDVLYFPKPCVRQLCQAASRPENCQRILCCSQYILADWNVEAFLTVEDGGNLMQHKEAFTNTLR